MLTYHLIPRDQQKTAQWAGGTTTELSIYPADSLYSERNFSLRLSSATVVLDSSEFTPLAGYTRHIMLLEGEMRLSHQGHHEISLPRFGTDCFEGAWQTTSYGKCTDFNLMLAAGWEGQLTTLRAGHTSPWHSCSQLTGFYCLVDHCQLILAQKGQAAREISLQKGDFFSIPPQAGGAEYQLSLQGENEAEGQSTPCVVYAAAWPVSGR
ncbi:MAG: HutD/Ves family protein [Enterobacteriaceae bacterium]